ncbi:hypothetical protein LZ30DRAFT_254209 [Colletotrichum cereale]|nr:hypothetical protein LZ30DRAFT_254209 [Colletotrichum cereale]
MAPRYHEFALSLCPNAVSASHHCGKVTRKKKRKVLNKICKPYQCSRPALLHAAGLPGRPLLQRTSQPHSDVNARLAWRTRICIRIIYFLHVGPSRPYEHSKSAGTGEWAPQQVLEPQTKGRERPCNGWPCFPASIQVETNLAQDDNRFSHNCKENTSYLRGETADTRVRID